MSELYSIEEAPRRTAKVGHADADRLNHKGTDGAGGASENRRAYSVTNRANNGAGIWSSGANTMPSCCSVILFVASWARTWIRCASNALSSRVFGSGSCASSVATAAVRSARSSMSTVAPPGRCAQPKTAQDSR